MTTTPTTTPTTTKAFVKLITIDVAEGHFAVRGASKTTHTSWQSANERIQQICAKAPETGGYDKCDVVVVWEDDHSYAFRYDAARVGSASHEGMLHDRIKGGLLYSAGLKCPVYMSEERYHSNLSDPLLDGRKHQATRMLKTLHFVDVEHTPEFKEIPDMNTTTTPIQTAMEKAREAARAHTDSLRAKMATPAPAPAPVTRSITPAQVYAASAPAPVIPKPKAKKDPIDSLKPTDLRRRIKGLITGAELVAKDSTDPRWAEAILNLKQILGDS